MTTPFSLLEKPSSTNAYNCSGFFSGMLMGIFDGHGGGACAQVVSKRIFNYIAACLLPPEQLQRYLSSLDAAQPLDLIDSYNEKVQFVEDVRELYKNSFSQFVSDLFKVSKVDETIWCRNVL